MSRSGLSWNYCLIAGSVFPRSFSTDLCPIAFMLTLKKAVHALVYSLCFRATVIAPVSSNRWLLFIGREVVGNGASRLVSRLFSRYGFVIVGGFHRERDPHFAELYHFIQFGAFPIDYGNRLVYNCSFFFEIIASSGEENPLVPMQWKITRNLLGFCLPACRSSCWTSI